MADAAPAFPTYYLSGWQLERSDDEPHRDPTAAQAPAAASSGSRGRAAPPREPPVPRVSHDAPVPALDARPQRARAGVPAAAPGPPYRTCIACGRRALYDPAVMTPCTRAGTRGCDAMLCGTCPVPRQAWANVGGAHCRFGYGCDAPKTAMAKAAGVDHAPLMAPCPKRYRTGLGGMPPPDASTATGDARVTDTGGGGATVGDSEHSHSGAMMGVGAAAAGQPPAAPPPPVTGGGGGAMTTAETGSGAGGPAPVLAPPDGPVPPSVLALIRPRGSGEEGDALKDLFGLLKALHDDGHCDVATWQMYKRTLRGVGAEELMDQHGELLARIDAWTRADVHRFFGGWLDP